MEGRTLQYDEFLIFMDKLKFLALGRNDEIVESFVKNLNFQYISTWKDLRNFEKTLPLVFRGMTQRKTVNLCEEQNRDYFYIDTGYLGNKNWKKWHRVVKNGMQHSEPNDNLPTDRFKALTVGQEHLRFSSWKKNGRSILLVTPSEKPCLFYGVDRNKWVQDTINEIKKYTDRPIVVRNKVGSRKERAGDKSIYNQIIQDNVFAVVTYNSIAATESVSFGIPAFALAPNFADPLCLKDLSKIETPLYSDKDKVTKWQNWLGYCQYTTEEMRNGSALKIIEDYNIK